METFRATLLGLTDTLRFEAQHQDRMLAVLLTILSSCFLGAVGCWALLGTHSFQGFWISRYERDSAFRLPLARLASSCVRSRWFIVYARIWGVGALLMSAAMTYVALKYGLG